MDATKEQQHLLDNGWQPKDGGWCHMRAFRPTVVPLETATKIQKMIDNWGLDDENT